MIRPRARLTFWFGLTVLPFAAAIGLAPTWAPICLAAIGMMVLIALLDAFVAPRPLRGMSAHLPAVVRFTRDKEGEIAVTVMRESDRAERTVSIGLGLPMSVESPAESLRVRLPMGVAACHVSWCCTPRQRGRTPVRDVYVDVDSPLGFWGAHGALPVEAELRSYPNLLPERRHLAGLFLDRGGMGIHARRQVGQGREFEKLREYMPGDSFEDIHWRATAKRGRPITKQYQIERTQEIYVIVDASRMSARDVPGAPESGPPDDREPTVLEYYLRAALVLGLVAERQGDLFGLATFSDRVHAFVRARNGKAHFDACRDALYTLQPEPVTPDFNELCAFLRTRLRRRALLLFLTSLDDPQLAESFARNMELLGNQHVVIAAMFRPLGARPLFSEPVADIDSIYSALAGHLTWESLRHLTIALRRRGVQFTLLDHEHLCADLVTQYITIKQRQLL